MRLQFLGSGDAFGSGGRFNTCLLLQTETTRCLLDCGASSLIAMKRFGVDPNSISLILITHFHGDHFGGLPFFLLDAQFAKRRDPLTIVGPPGLSDHLTHVREISFPGSSTTVPKFDLRLLEWEPGQALRLHPLVATPYEVSHSENLRAFALRIAAEGRAITYSGDTEWCSGLAEAASGADLFVCEAYVYEKPVKGHLALKTLEAQLPALQTKRLILTHLGPDTLAREGSLGHEVAEDGQIVAIAPGPS